MREELKQSEEGLAFEGLKTHYGFKNLMDLFKSMYAEALEKLIDADDLKARVTIEVIEEIVNSIDDTINLGKEAREELKNKVFENQT